MCTVNHRTDLQEVLKDSSLVIYQKAQNFYPC